MSLTQTVAQIRSGVSLREMQIEQPRRLIGAIQNVAIVKVPGYLGSVASLTTMLKSNRSLTPTETGELAYSIVTSFSNSKSEDRSAMHFNST